MNMLASRLSRSYFSFTSITEYFKHIFKYIMFHERSLTKGRFNLI